MAVGEWDQRQLCPDGGCVGVIGPDGTCKVCGRAAQNWGDERTRGLNVPPDEQDEAAADDDDLEDDGEEGEDEENDEDEDEEDDDDSDDDDDASAPPAVTGTGIAASSPPAEWGARQLCPDGSCIGVIGDDGRCKVCGRAASGAPPDEPASPAAAAPPSPPADAPDTSGAAGETASTDPSGDGKLTV